MPRPKGKRAEKTVKLDDATHKALRVESAKTGKTIGQLIAALWASRKKGNKREDVSNQ